MYQFGNCLRLGQKNTKFKQIVEILHIYLENSEKNDLNNEYSEEFTIHNNEDIIQEADVQESFEIVLNSPLELFVYKFLFLNCCY